MGCIHLYSLKNTEPESRLLLWFKKKDFKKKR